MFSRAAPGLWDSDFSGKCFGKVSSQYFISKAIGFQLVEDNVPVEFYLSKSVLTFHLFEKWCVTSSGQLLLGTFFMSLTVAKSS